MSHKTHIGIFGGGQLGRMLAQAALPLGITCTFLENQTDCPASSLGKVITPKDVNYLDSFIDSAEVFTLEFENTSLADADYVLREKMLHPPRNALAIAQNRLLEKGLLTELGIPVPPYAKVESLTDLQTAINTLGLPLVIKTAMGGYDGKGQFIIRETSQIETAWQELGVAKLLIAESFVKFDREVSIIAVRGIDGDIKCYPLAQNHHHHGILSHSIVPAPNADQITLQASDYISRLLQHLNYVGVLTLELFVTPDGLLANEIAPRVHNSGHWSIEGAVCSQFENHMRAIAGLPLGSTDVVKPSVMINIIGKHPKIADVLAIDGAHLHLYNKTERTGRKLGHITLMPTDSSTLPDLCLQIAKILPEPLALLDN